MLEDNGLGFKDVVDIVVAALVTAFVSGVLLVGWLEVVAAVTDKHLQTWQPFLLIRLSGKLPALQRQGRNSGQAEGVGCSVEGPVEVLKAG